MFEFETVLLAPFVTHARPNATADANGTSAVTLSEIACDMVEVSARRGNAAAVQASLAQLSPSVDLLATAPGTWLVRAPRAADGVLAGRVLQSLGSIAAIIDQSSATVTFRVQGRSACVALAKICRLDLAASVFLPGAAARTVLAQVPAVVYRPRSVDAAIDDSGDAVFDIAVPNTLAVSFVGILVHCAAEYGLTIPPPGQTPGPIPGPIPGKS